jgi:hypothetical protein
MMIYSGFLLVTNSGIESKKMRSSAAQAVQPNSSWRLISRLMYPLMCSSSLATNVKKCLKQEMI